MMYIDTIALQTRIFFYAFGFGFLLGVLYDVFRIIRLCLTNGKRFVLTQDILYVLCCSLMTILFALAVNNGEMRFYLFLGEILGWLVYYFALGTIAVKFSRKVIFGIRRLFRQCLRIVKRPVLYIYRKLSKKFTKAGGKVKKNQKKIANKSKFLLHVHKAMMYNKKDKRGSDTETAAENNGNGSDLKVKKKRKHSFILSITIAACLCYFVIMWIHLQMDIQDRKDTYEQVSGEYAQQLEANEKLEKTISDGISEEEMERIAREELGYVMPGEHVYADASSGK